MTMYLEKLPSEELPWTFAARWDDYSPARVDAIKQTIPARSRRWDSRRSRWLFRDDQWDAVCALARETGEPVVIVDLVTGQCRDLEPSDGRQQPDLRIAVSEEDRSTIAEFLRRLAQTEDTSHRAQADELKRRDDSHRDETGRGADSN